MASGGGPEHTPLWAPEAVKSAHLLTEYGHWPYSVPLYDLPEELGGEILEIVLTHQSWSHYYLRRIMGLLEAMARPSPKS